MKLTHKTKYSVLAQYVRYTCGGAPSDLLASSLTLLAIGSTKAERYRGGIVNPIELAMLMQFCSDFMLNFTVVHIGTELQDSLL